MLASGAVAADSGDRSPVVGLHVRPSLHVGFGLAFSVRSGMGSEVVEEGRNWIEGIGEVCKLDAICISLQHNSLAAAVVIKVATPLGKGYFMSNTFGGNTNNWASQPGDEGDEAQTCCPGHGCF